MVFFKENWGCHLSLQSSKSVPKKMHLSLRDNTSWTGFHYLLEIMGSIEGSQRGDCLPINVCEYILIGVNIV